MTAGRMQDPEDEVDDMDRDDDTDHDDNDNVNNDNVNDDNVDMDTLHPITPADFLPSIPAELHGIIMIILQELSAMKPAVMGSITVTNLRSQPHLTVPIYVALLGRYDTFKRQNPDAPVHVPTFTLLPQIHHRHRCITMNTATIPALLARRHLPRNVAPMPGPDDQRQHYSSTCVPHQCSIGY